MCFNFSALILSILWLSPSALFLPLTPLERELKSSVVIVFCCFVLFGGFFCWFFLVWVLLILCKERKVFVLAVCSCVRLLWYAHSSTWCCVGGERCNFAQSSIQKAGKLSFNCSVYFNGLIFLLFFMLKDNNSLRKY